MSSYYCKELSTSPSVFSCYFKIISSLLKEPDIFLEYELWELLPQYGRKALVTTIFFEQKI